MTAVDATALTASLARLEEVFRADSLEPQAMLQQVVNAADTLFRLSGAGLMFVDADEVLRYVAASDQTIALLEEAQEELGEGPCVDTFVHDKVIEVRDLAEDERWPELSKGLAHRGIRAVLGVPVRLGGGAVGALNLYVDQPNDWDPGEIEALNAYGTMVETMLASILVARRHSQIAAQLQYALDNRVTIERAVGFLMAGHDTDAVHAFDLLRRTARHSRRKVADVARDVLAGAPLPEIAQSR